VRRPAIAITALAVVLGLVGCSAPRQVQRVEQRAPAAATPTPPAPAGSAPSRAFAVGTRTLKLANRPERPLPTTVFYPATGSAGRNPRSNATPASGRFPVIVFSHGLGANGAAYQNLLARWAAAGFLVVAPSYPHTSWGVAKFDVLDVVNQPDDASYVLTSVLALDTKSGDPLRGHIATGSVAAAGHSAGGITTVGLFTSQRDERLRAGIVLAGNGVGMGDKYTGPTASLLFVHGEQDTTVPYAMGKVAYDHVPWPKALLSLPKEAHIEPYLIPGGKAFEAVAKLTTDFLRWTLYGDRAAKQRLPRAATGVGILDNRL